MSRLHLLILWILAIGAGLIFFHSGKAPDPSSSATKFETGSSLFESNLIETINGLIIESDGKKTTLTKSDGEWLVAEQQNYPANFSSVSRVLDALRDTKVGQGVVASQEYYDRFNLDPSAEDKDERPDTITLKNPDGEEGQIFLGKSRKATGGSANTAGRFVRLADDDSGVYIVQDGFNFINADSASWIDNTLSPLEEGTIKIEVSAPNDDTFNSWTVSRKTVMDDFLVQTLGEKEETKTSETGTLKNVLSRATFIELLTEEEALNRGDQKGVREVQATDSAGSTFLITLTPEKKKKEDQAPEPKEGEPAPSIDYIATIKILNGPTKPETPAENATLQEKAVYEQRIINLSDLSSSIARMRRTFEGRHYLVNKGTISPLLNNRGQFIQPKPEKKVKTSVATPPIKIPTASSNNTLRNPASPPPLLTRPESDQKKPRIETVTPPIPAPPVKEESGE